MGKDELTKATTAEEIIAALRDDPADNPLCWIMCYEDRPLQGRPQGGTQPHLMIFTTKAIGLDFIQGRSRYFAPEPLEVVPVDSPGTLSKLSLAKAFDSRYSAPPCGLLLNFSYSTGKADVEVEPDTIAEQDIEDIVEALGLEIPEETPEEAPEEEEASEANIEEPTHCPLCKKKLYMPHRGGISIGFGDAALEAMFEKPDLAHTAYACKKCGTRICQTCATKYVCPRCKNNTFDRFDLAALPPPPPLPATPSKPKAARAKKPRAEKPRAVPAVKAAAPAASEVETPVIKPIPALTAAPRPATVPAPKSAAPPAPSWWMIAAGAALVLAIILLVIRPWDVKTEGVAAGGITAIRTAAGMTAAAIQSAPETNHPTPTPGQTEAPAREPAPTDVVAEPTPTEAATEIVPTLAPFEPFALPGGEEFGEVVALSPKVTYAASGNCQGVVRLWKGRTFIRDIYTGEGDCVADITFTADETLMAVSFMDKGKIFVADVATGRLIGELSMSSVDEIEFSHQGNWLAAGSHGNGTGLWDLTGSTETQLTYRTMFIIEGNPDNSFTCLEFDPQDEFLAIGEETGGVKVWDLKAGQVAYAIDATCAAPRSMSFSLDRDYGGFLYFSDNQSQNVLNLTTGDLNVVRTFPFQVDSAAAFVPRIEFTALVNLRLDNFTIDLWDNYHGKLLRTLKGHKMPIFSIQFSEDGTLLLSGGYDYALRSGEVYLWNTSEILP